MSEQNTTTAAVEDITKEQFRAAQKAEGLYLEREACGRCGGSGMFGPLCVYAGRCFRCGGTGKLYTKRGAAAAERLRALRSKPASHLEPGDRVFYQGFTAGSYTQPSRWERVLAVRAGDAKLDGGSVRPDGTVVAADLIVETDGCKHHVSYDTPFLVAHTRLAQLDTLRAAAAYQATLTKAGRPARA